MKDRKRKMIAVMIAAILTIYPVNAFAFETLTEYDYYYNSIVAEEAGIIVMGLMEVILNEYVGSDVTIDELYDGALLGISDVLDEYSSYMSDEEFYEFIKELDATEQLFGVVVSLDDQDELFVNSVLKGSGAEEAGLQAGDYIKTINGADAAGLTPSDAVELMNIRLDNVATIVVLRQGEERTFTITKGTVRKESVGVYDFSELLEDVQDYPDMKYVYMNAVGEDTHNEIAEMLEEFRETGVNKIVLDLRNNGGGYVDVAVDICKQLVPEGVIIYSAEKNGTITAVHSDLKQVPLNQIIILVNEFTASSAEIIASALQDSGSQVIGQQTYGKGVIQSLFELPVGGTFKLTTGEYYRRSGDKINTIGITPDVYVDIPRYLAVIETNTDTINLKKILSVLGFYSGQINNNFDQPLKEALYSYKTQKELTANSELDADTILHLNEDLYKYFMKNDVALEKAYAMLTQ